MSSSPERKAVLHQQGYGTLLVVCQQKNLMNQWHRYTGAPPHTPRLDNEGRPMIIVASYWFLRIRPSVRRMESRQKKISIKYFLRRGGRFPRGQGPAVGFSVPLPRIQVAMLIRSTDCAVHLVKTPWRYKYYANAPQCFVILHCLSHKVSFRFLEIRYWQCCWMKKL